MDFNFLSIVFAGFIRTLKLVFNQRKVQGEIIRDAGLASLVNFMYTNDKGIYELILVVVSFLGIIIGVILKEGVSDEWNNN